MQANRCNSTLNNYNGKTKLTTLQQITTQTNIEL